MKTLINEGFVGLLFENGKLTRTLSPGAHPLHRLFDSTERTVVKVDVRERSTIIKNQEILTADKVSVRLSLLVYFKVVDPVAAHTKLADFEERIYEDVQLAARRFLATRALDQILLDRNELSNAIKADVAASLLAYGVEILRADVKDLVFPGALREVMNKVIETARQAEAQLISAEAKLKVAALEAKSRSELAELDAQARAQVARLDAAMKAEALQVEAKAQSLALDEKLKSDAKLLELLGKNPLLVKVKELETLERIGAKGNNHFYVGVDPRQTK